MKRFVLWSALLLSMNMLTACTGLDGKTVTFHKYEYFESAKFAGEQQWEVTKFITVDPADWSNQPKKTNEVVFKLCGDGMMAKEFQPQRDKHYQNYYLRKKGDGLKLETVKLEKTKAADGSTECWHVKDYVVQDPS